MDPQLDHDTSLTKRGIFCSPPPLSFPFLFTPPLFFGFTLRPRGKKSTAPPPPWDHSSEQKSMEMESSEKERSRKCRLLRFPQLVTWMKKCRICRTIACVLYVRGKNCQVKSMSLCIHAERCDICGSEIDRHTSQPGRARIKTRTYFVQ